MLKSSSALTYPSNSFASLSQNLVPSVFIAVPVNGTTTYPVTSFKNPIRHSNWCTWFVYHFIITCVLHRQGTPHGIPAIISNCIFKSMKHISHMQVNINVSIHRFRNVTLSAKEWCPLSHTIYKKLTENGLKI